MTLEEAKGSIGDIVSWGERLPWAVRCYRVIEVVENLIDHPVWGRELWVSKKHRFMAVLEPAVPGARVSPWVVASRKTRVAPIHALRPLNDEERGLLASHLLTEGA